MEEIASSSCKECDKLDHFRQIRYQIVVIQQFLKVAWGAVLAATKFLYIQLSISVSGITKEKERN